MKIYFFSQKPKISRACFGIKYSHNFNQSSHRFSRYHRADHGPLKSSTENLFSSKESPPLQLKGFSIEMVFPFTNSRHRASGSKIHRGEHRCIANLFSSSHTQSFQDCFCPLGLHPSHSETSIPPKQCFSKIFSLWCVILRQPLKHCLKTLLRLHATLASSLHPITDSSPVHVAFTPSDTSCSDQLWFLCLSVLTAGDSRPFCVALFTVTHLSAACFDTQTACCVILTTSNCELSTPVSPASLNIQCNGNVYCLFLTMRAIQKVNIRLLV